MQNNELESITTDAVSNNNVTTETEKNTTDAENITTATVNVENEIKALKNLTTDLENVTTLTVNRGNVTTPKIAENTNIDVSNSFEAPKKIAKKLPKKATTTVVIDKKPTKKYNSITGNFTTMEWNELVKPVLIYRIQHGLSNDANHFVRQLFDFAINHHTMSSQYLCNIPYGNNGLFGYDIDTKVQPLTSKGFYNK